MTLPRRLVAGIALTAVAISAAAATMLLAKELVPPAERARAAVAAGPAGSPVVFVERVVEQVVDNQYGLAWETLHPAHQRVAPLDEYVACEERSPIPGRLAGIHVLGVRDERLRIAGERAVPSKAIRLRITIRDLATGQRAAVTSTFHAVAVGRAWRWVMPPQRFELYRADTCAAAPPAASY